MFDNLNLPEIFQNIVTQRLQTETGCLKFVAVECDFSDVTRAISSADDFIDSFVIIL